MTRRSKGWIGVAILAGIVVLGLVWALALPDAETDVYSDELSRQNRTGEGSNVDGISGQKAGSESVLLPEEPGANVEGSTEATDSSEIIDTDAQGETEGGSNVQPDEVVSPERGEVQNDTGMVMVEPNEGSDGNADDTDQSGGQATGNGSQNETLRETN